MLGTKYFDSILLVDDDSISTYMARFFLENIGIADKIFETSGGEEACQFLTENTVDLIFRDINMPAMDGFEFIVHARKMGVLKNAKIIVLSSSNAKEEVDSSYNVPRSNGIHR